MVSQKFEEVLRDKTLCYKILYLSTCLLKRDSVYFILDKSQKKTNYILSFADNLRVTEC